MHVYCSRALSVVVLEGSPHYGGGTVVQFAHAGPASIIQLFIGGDTIENAKAPVPFPLDLLKEQEEHTQHAPDKHL